MLVDSMNVTGTPSERNWSARCWDRWRRNSQGTGEKKYMRIRSDGVMCQVARHNGQIRLCYSQQCSNHGGSPVQTVRVNVFLDGSRHKA